MSQQSLDEYRLARAGALQQPQLANQELFFSEQRSNKRGPPSPTVSGLTTPQEPAGAAIPTAAPAAQEATLVQPVFLEDQPALQAVAADFGINANDPAAVEQFYNTPVHTAGEVMKLVRGYHKRIIRPEFLGMVAQLENAVRKVNDSVFQCQQELQFMVTENRSSQKHASGMMLVTTGWPNGLTPPQRLYMIGWMLGQTAEIVQYLQNRGQLAAQYDPDTITPHFWLNVLQNDPTTVPQSGGFYSGMTLLTFRSWELRSAFLKKYGGQSGLPLYVDANTPQPGKHIRVAPCTPQWQRKLESPLRVLIAAINAHPDTQGQQITILWKTLTIMQPTEDRDFRPDRIAWARLWYEEQGGTFAARLEVHTDFAKILLGPAQDASSGEESLWNEMWNSTMWGSQMELDKAEKEAYNAAKLQCHTSGKGVNFGKGRKHWSHALLHNSSYSPYPFTLHFTGTDHIAYVWDEYCDKCGKPEEKVGSYEVATYGGKPATVHTAGTTADEDMPDLSSDPGFGRPNAESSQSSALGARAADKGKSKGGKTKTHGS